MSDKCQKKSDYVTSPRTQSPTPTPTISTSDETYLIWRLVEGDGTLFHVINSLSKTVSESIKESAQEWHAQKR